MKKREENLMDVSRLYTLKDFAKTFGHSYGTVYSKYNSTLAGIAKNGFDLRDISDQKMIYVSPEFEKELLSKKKGRK